jgi:hypothetical protein
MDWIMEPSMEESTSLLLQSVIITCGLNQVAVKRPMLSDVRHSGTGQMMAPEQLAVMLTTLTEMLAGFVNWKLNTVSSVVGIECAGSTLTKSALRDCTTLHCPLGWLKS